LKEGGKIDAYRFDNRISDGALRTRETRRLRDFLKAINTNLKELPEIKAAIAARPKTHWWADKTAI
jgi:hypothetical protein